MVVLDVNREKERVSLGLKQKLANPWESIESKFTVGQKVKEAKIWSFPAPTIRRPKAYGTLAYNPADWI